MTHDDFHTEDHPRDEHGMLVRSGADVRHESMPSPTRDTTLAELTAELAAAYVRHNAVPASALPELIGAVHAALSSLSGPAVRPAPAEPQQPAVPVAKSVTDDYIVCLEDGRRLKSLKRHLAGMGMTSEQYRRKWDLPFDYPMVAPAYAAKRSEIAKGAGLGRTVGREREAA